MIVDKIKKRNLPEKNKGVRNRYTSWKMGKMFKM